MPTGPGALYKRNEKGRFKWETLVVKRQGWSIEAVEWLNFEQSLAPFTTPGVVIRHAMNGGERSFELVHPVTNEVVVTNPDGYAEVNGVRYFLYYDGCNFHTCEKCAENGKTDRNPNARSKADDEKRDEAVKSVGVLKRMRGCEWAKKKKEVQFDNRTSYFYNQKSIKEEKLWDAITSGRLFGLIQCDITSTPHSRQKWLDLNFPPIFAHVKVEENMLDKTMIDAVNAHPHLKFPLEQQLTLVFNQKNYILTTELALFYLEHGFELTNLSLVIEYERDQPFMKFVNAVTSSRIEATRRGDDQAQACYKMTANAGYGTLLMNVKKRRKYRYMKTNDNAGISRLRRVSAKVPLHGEFQSEYSEVEQIPSKQTDTVPVHLGVFILQNSKLHFLKFLATLHHYCDVKAMRLLYCDTGKSESKSHLTNLV